MALRALIVDDSKATRGLLSRELQGIGFHTEAAGTVAEAETLLEGASYDVLLVDWNLPDTEGLELVRRHRSRRGLWAGFVMMVSSEADAGQVQRALNAGADEYLVKPFGREALLHKLGLHGMIRA
jgi:two-component system chemotaxis response regulator CheY